MDNCTHLGCTFPWNAVDQQFQCPCHGSLYASDGTVIRGPAPPTPQDCSCRRDGQ
ncbi:Rieske 2Fe-2S domain-containing protein [Leptothermofonsia sp. ETS-13]|uniref:Rieske 2Fe-2S domain-containing protein n=1 Tax=Leptothermofonsia sp. ETS-13 TaxID=3035696 RepID=UPI003B9F49CA